MRNIISLSLVLAAFLLYTGNANANEIHKPEKLKGTIINIDISDLDDTSDVKDIEILLNDSSSVKTRITPHDPNYNVEYKVGNKVVLQKFSIGGDQESYIITDFNRINYLGFLLIIFSIMSILIGKKYGFYSLIGMCISFAMIFKFILPRILDGGNPVLITVLASFVIVPVTFYLSHGLNKKTHVAIVSTFIALIITSIFAALSVKLANLTGFSSDEAMFLQIGNSSINMRGILLAGIIIGFLGVMDDVTVAQAGIVMKLAKTKRNMSVPELYHNAMDIGRDHITSMVNTLVLVYAGASLPLLLMFIRSSEPALDVLNTEIIADEVVRTLVGSIGLIISVPISTLLASVVASEN